MSVSCSSMLFAVPYERPTSFSDPHHVFIPEDLEQLIETADPNLGWEEFRYIFQLASPAGGYSETVYFLPHALSFMALNPDDALDCISGVLWYMSHYADEILRDNIYQVSQEAVLSCFAHWMSTFVVRHFDEEACRKRRWRQASEDVVFNSQLISQCVDDLFLFKRHKEVAENVIVSLASQRDQPLHSAWFLEFASRTRRNYSFWDSDEGQIMNKDGIMTLTRSSKKIQEAIFNQALLCEHFSLIESNVVAREPSPTYWNTVKTLLEF